MKVKSIAVGMAVLMFASAVPFETSARAASSDAFQAEVLSVTGNVYAYSTAGTKRGLLEGDVLQEGDSIETMDGGKVEIALDGDWKNVITVEQRTQVLIDTLYPTSLQMTQGDVFAKLDELPKESSFEVRTPVLIASVRGTTYRTRYQEGDSQVYSYSDSPVYVYGRQKDGTPMTDPVILKNKETTVAQNRGDFPEVPAMMTSSELDRGTRFKDSIKKHIESVQKEGRRPKIQPIDRIKRDWQPRDKARKERRLRDQSSKGGPGGPGGSSGGALVSGSGSSIVSPRDRFFNAVDAPTPKSAADLALEEENAAEMRKEQERRNFGKQSLGSNALPPGADPFAKQKIQQGPGGPSPQGFGQPQQQPGQAGSAQKGPRRPPPPRGGGQK